MLRAMLLAQWRACWHVVVALTIAAIALPIASVRTSWHGSQTVLAAYLSELQLWGAFYPVLAAVSATALAAAGWASDRRGHHVYALLHPLPRWRYVVLRYLAGAVLLVPIVLGVWLGAVGGVASLDLPPGLRGFEHLLALKFGLAMLLCYGIAFMVAASSPRTLGIAVRALGLFLAVHTAVYLLDPNVNLLWRLVESLAAFPGPLSPLGGPWMLIDV